MILHKTVFVNIHPDFEKSPITGKIHHIHGGFFGMSLFLTLGFDQLFYTKCK